MADQPKNRSTSMDLATILSAAPIRLAAPGRGEDLQVRVSAPATGDNLPLIVFAHGAGQSLYGYGPLVNYWAAHGFVVINPTLLDSRMLALTPEDPRQPDIWRFREQDMVRVLDDLDLIEAAVPAIAGRLDRSRIAAAGHSWGAQTASTLLGATHPDPSDGTTVSIKDSRVKAGVLLALPGRGGDNLIPAVAQHYPFMQPDFSGMTPPALVVAGGDDHIMSVRGPVWWRDGYDLSPGARALFTAFGGQHSLGGIPGYEAAETTDEDPDRVAAIQRLSTAFLRSTLDSDDATWTEAVKAERARTQRQGSIETK